MTCVVVDVETTGLGHAGFPPRADGVVQVGIAWRQDGDVSTWSAYCNPGDGLLAGDRAFEALRINRIPIESIRKSLPVQAVAKDFWKQVDAVEAESGEAAEFLAYNRSFDEGFLKKEPWSVPSHKWGACVMKRAAAHLTGGSRLKLARAMQLLAIPWPGGHSHDAAIDAHAALLVNEKIIGRE